MEAINKLLLSFVPIGIQLLVKRSASENRVRHSPDRYIVELVPKRSVTSGQSTIETLVEILQILKNIEGVQNKVLLNQRVSDAARKKNGR